MRLGLHVSLLIGNIQICVLGYILQLRPIISFHVNVRVLRITHYSLSNVIDNNYHNLKNILNHNKWLLEFIFWELSFYKCVGYDIEFKDYVSEEIGSNGNKKYFVKSTKKNVPNFLIDKNFEIDNYNELLIGFKIVGDYLEKTILKTIGINYPSSRSNLYTSIKNLSLFDQQNMKL